MLTVVNQSLWGDEAFSAVLSMNPVSKILQIISRDTSPPLYNLILHFWYQLFGTSEVSIRTLSFLFFILAIIFVYKIGNLLWGQKTGLWAALITFFNPFFFTYAFEGRMYSILALGVCASMYFFLEVFFKTKPNLWIRVGYILSTACALYSHHFAIFALFLQGLMFFYLLLTGKKQTAKIIFKSFLIIGLLYLPWLFPLYQQIKMVGGGFWLGKPTLTDLRNLIYEYLAEGIKNPQIKLSLLNKNLGQIALYFSFAILLFRNWTKKLQKTVILLLWFFLPIILTWLISQKMQSIFFNRYLLYCIPGITLILTSNRQKISNILLAIFIGLLVIIDLNYFFHPTKKPFQQFASYIQANKTSEHLLINWNSTAHHLWESKYYKVFGPIYLPTGDLPYYVGTAQMTPDDILKVIPQKITKLGVITSGDPKEVVISNFSQTDVKSFNELKIVWLQRKK